MGYQPFTINGSGGFSRVNSPACRTGAVACVEGACWVRFLHTATLTQDNDGANALITTPAADANGFTDGWAYVPEGGAVTYGTELVADTTNTEPVNQIDLYLVGSSIVTVNQH